MPALAEVFQYVPLTEMVQRVMGGIPKVLPEAFYTQTRDIPGDRYRRTTFRGTRQLARVSRYGSPPRNTKRIAHGMQDIVMLHQIEQVQASSELLQLIRKWDTYEAQRWPATSCSRTRSSSAAGREPPHRRDPREPRLRPHLDRLRGQPAHEFLRRRHRHRLPDPLDQHRPGGTRARAPSSTRRGRPRRRTSRPTCSTSRRGSGSSAGYELKYAFMGKNVPGYLATNTSFQQYLARNPVANQKYIDTGTVPDGTLGLTWVPVQDAFYADSNDAVTQIFPADQVTFYPEISRRPTNWPRAATRCPSPSRWPPPSRRSPR
jgi:hypothetical protein